MVCFANRGFTVVHLKLSIFNNHNDHIDKYLYNYYDNSYLPSFCRGNNANENEGRTNALVFYNDRENRIK